MSSVKGEAMKVPEIAIENPPLPRQVQAGDTTISISGNGQWIDLNRGSEALTLLPREEARLLGAALLKETEAT